MQIIEAPEIVKAPNRCLVTKCEEAWGYGDMCALGQKLVEIARAQGALGLAANQVGALVRVFVMRKGAEFFVFINPEIVTRSNEVVTTIESCLSYPGKKVRTRRAAWITVEYETNDTSGRYAETLSGNEAICFQHELDHLNGKTMFDREATGRGARG